MLDKAKVADFSQVTVMAPKVQVNKAATDGACHCFSLQWLSLMLTDTRSAQGSAPSRMATLSKSHGGANLILQKVFGIRWGTDGMDNADALVQMNYRLKLQDVLKYDSYNLTKLAKGLSTQVSKGGGFLYSFWFHGSIPGAAGGAHSIAFYVTRMGLMSVVHIFDPNFGEFVCSGTEFAQAFKELMQKYGPVHHHVMRAAAQA
jgi:hypothetical protein